MKKLRLVTLLALISMLTLLVLVGCKKEDGVASVLLKDHDPDTVIEIALGEFDYNSYTVVVSYESGNTEEIALTKEMIAETDLFKLYQIGDHEITIHYGKQTYTFKLSVKRATFGELVFPENNVFTYDGNEHVVEVDGNIPANAVVTYLGGNSFVNAGTYDVTAVVSCEGYVTQKLSTTVKIERAKYDMSSVKFEAKEFVYDGLPHSVSISGTLPEGVLSPTYFIKDKETSSAVDAGEYKVIAKFANNDPNYETIPDMETTLKIIPAEYTVKGVNIVFRNEDERVIDGTTKIYDGTSVLFDLNDYSKLSKKISVSFSVSDKEGKVISTSNKVTNIKNAGVYTVKVEFALEGGKNYQPIEPIVSTFEVLKAEYPLIDNISLVSTQATYDGKAHSIAIEGKLPEGVTVSYEYYLGSTLIKDGHGNPVKAVIEAGIYTVKAMFTHNDANFGKIADISATLNIKKAEVDLASVGFVGESILEYSGNSYEPSFTTWKETNVTNYDILQYASIKYYVFDSVADAYIEMDKNELPTNVGMYRAVIEVSVANAYKNNYTLAVGGDVYKSIKQFEIVPKELDVRNIEFDSVEFVYNGSNQYPYFTNLPAHVLTLVTLYDADGTSIEQAINAGNYSCEIELIPQDSNYVLLGDTTYTFEFTIKKVEIDLDAILVERTYSDTNLDLTTKVFDDLDQEIKNFLGYNFLKLEIESGGEWYEVFSTSYLGFYRITYYVCVKPEYTSNVTLLYKGESLTTLGAEYYFYIK